MIRLLFNRLNKPIFFVCLAITVLLFSPAFSSVSFDPFLSLVLLLLAAIPAAVATMLVSSLRSAAVLAKSRARIEELARLYPQLAELEKKRGRLMEIQLIFSLSVIAALVLSFLTFSILGILIVVAITPVAYLLLNMKKREDEIRASFKQVIVLDELNRAFTEVQLNPDACFPLEEIDGLKLFSAGNSITGNDLLEAKRGEIHFCRCDMSLENTSIYVDDKGRRNLVCEPIFKGSVFRFELSEQSPARLLVATEGFGSLRETGGVLKKLLGKADERSVETEMDEFNRRFDCYCSDQVNARILLTPQMIMGINRVGQMVKHEFALLFEGSLMYLFLSTPGVDSFELALKNSQTIKQQHEVIAAQVALITEIIDNLYFRRA